MILRFGADVRDPDGGKLGALTRAVLDADGRTLHSLVVEHSALDDREVVLPVDCVTDSDDEAVETDMWEEDFTELEDFATERNVAPPPDADNVRSDLIEDPIDVPDVPAVGAATGVESIAFTPMVEEEVHIPTGTLVLDGNTVIWATDGELGRLTQLSMDDETLALGSLIAEHGFFPHRSTEIDAGLIEGIQPEAVVLRVARTSVEARDE